MRIGILTHSVPAALPILAELERGQVVYILLLPEPGVKRVTGMLKHLVRLLLRPGRFATIRQLIRGRVKLVNPPIAKYENIRKIKELELDVGLHNSGVIYRQPVIEAFSIGILNAHIGMLPRYRGRNVMEWAIIEKGPVGISVFIIDTGIDTGERIVLSEEVDITNCRSIGEAKYYLFNLAGDFYRRAIQVIESQGFEYKLNMGVGRRYYVMSRLFKKVVSDRIRG